LNIKHSKSHTKKEKHKACAPFCIIFWFV